jgi:ribosomal protein L7/L12
MNSKNNISPSQIVYNHIKEGRKIEAIKILREETGIGLKEAKEFIEKFELKNIPKQSSVQVSGLVLDELRKGSKIEAIKKYREETGTGLKDSKDIIERAIIENPEVKKQMDEVNKEKRKKAGIYLLIIGLIIILFYFL